MTHLKEKPLGLDRPSNVAIARWLASEAASETKFVGDVGNYERDCLITAATALQLEPPAIAEALREAELGTAHAWRGTFEETRSEAWACAAVAAILREA